MVIIVIRWNLIHAIVLEDLADVYVSSAILQVLIEDFVLVDQPLGLGGLLLVRIVHFGA